MGMDEQVSIVKYRSGLLTSSNYPLNPKFRASASQALQKAYKKGRFIKEGALYKVNMEFDVTASVRLKINFNFLTPTQVNPKATRKPQIGRQHPLAHSKSISLGGRPDISSSQFSPVRTYFLDYLLTARITFSELLCNLRLLAAILIWSNRFQARAICSLLQFIGRQAMWIYSRDSSNWIHDRM
jgi:hypothetical protein